MKPDLTLYHNSLLLKSCLYFPKKKPSALSNLKRKNEKKLPQKSFLYFSNRIFFLYFEMDADQA